eukprot:1729769-Pyramimonas_sp.AAC.1
MQSNAFSREDGEPRRRRFPFRGRAWGDHRTPHAVAGPSTESFALPVMMPDFLREDDERLRLEEALLQ